MASEFLDKSGLMYLWGKLKDKFSPKTHASQHASSGSDPITPAAIGTMRVYKSVTELGLTSGSATILDVWDALGNDEMLICSTAEFGSTELVTPSLSGTMEICRCKSNYGYVYFHSKTSAAPDYRMPLYPSTHETAPHRPSGKWMGLGPIRITLSSVSSLPKTINSAEWLAKLIRDDMVVLNCELTNPAAQIGAWTVSTADGSLTVSGSINGTTDITLVLGSVPI